MTHHDNLLQSERRIICSFCTLMRWGQSSAGYHWHRSENKRPETEQYIPARCASHECQDSFFPSVACLHFSRPFFWFLSPFFSFLILIWISHISSAQTPAAMHGHVKEIWYSLKTCLLPAFCKKLKIANVGTLWSLFLCLCIHVHARKWYSLYSQHPTAFPRARREKLDAFRACSTRACKVIGKVMVSAQRIQRRDTYLWMLVMQRRVTYLWMLVMCISVQLFVWMSVCEFVGIDADMCSRILKSSWELHAVGWPVCTSL